MTFCGEEGVGQTFNAAVLTGEGIKRNEVPSSEVDRSDAGDQSISPGLGRGRGARLRCLHFAVLAHGSVVWGLGLS